MLLAMQVADLLTLSRGLDAALFLYLGVSSGEAGLSAAVGLLILAWTADSLDGPLARRSPSSSPSWIGGLDLAFDVAVSMGLLGFLTSASLIPWSWFAAYLLVWTLIFLRCGFAPPLAMLIQAPVYGGFMAIALRGNSFTGTLLLIWISLATALTWPKLPREIIPDFLRGMSAVRRS